MTRNQNNLDMNTPFETLYNELHNSRREDDLRFPWQWKLTLNEYKRIKECFENNNLPDHENICHEIYMLMALYIGEFYKREYEGHGKDWPIAAKDICKKLRIIPYRRVNKSNLFTLYVRGGLPIHYLSQRMSDNEKTSFIKALSLLLDADDRIDVSEGESELGKIPNSIAIKESYQQGPGHSIYEYIQNIRQNINVWNEADNNFDDFRNFVQRIIESKNARNERQKFRLVFKLWTEYDEENQLLNNSYLSPILHFNPEQNGARHYALSKGRLEKWGVNLDNPGFNLLVKSGEDIIRKFFYAWCFNGDYIPGDQIVDIDLPSKIIGENLSTEYLLGHDFSVSIINSNDGHEIELEESIQNSFNNKYLQFYTNDDPSMASWTPSFSKGTNSFFWSCIIFDKSQYRLQSATSSVDISENLAWTYFRYFVELYDLENDKSIYVYNSKGMIYAKVKPTSTHPIVNNQLIIQGIVVDGKVDCIIGGEDTKAYIVNSSNIEFNIFRATTDEQLVGPPNVCYRMIQQEPIPISWLEYTSNKNLEQGMYVFRVSYAGYSDEVYCYVLSKDAGIEHYARTSPNWIRFNNINSVVSMQNLPNDGAQFRIEQNNSNSDFGFKIGDEHARIILKLYHPKPQVHVFSHGKKLDGSNIILALREHIKIRCISSNSSEEISITDNERANKFLFTTLTPVVENGDLPNRERNYDLYRINNNIPRNEYYLRAYTQEIGGNTQRGNLDFYFLDFQDNKVYEIQGQKLIDEARAVLREHNSIKGGLLFQSLKNSPRVDRYYSPKFISNNGVNLVPNERNRDRINRLTHFASPARKIYLDNYSLEQFKIACEHKLYFAIFDSLVSICWNASGTRRRPIGYLDRTSNEFKNRIFEFLKKLVNSDIPIDLTGLIRFSKEFLFDWSIISNKIGRSLDNNLKEIYEQLI